MNYVKKKELLINKLDDNQFKIESLFEIYYDCLDKLRTQYLSQEYKLRDLMDHFEKSLKHIVKAVDGYSIIEFFYEEKGL